MAAMSIKRSSTCSLISKFYSTNLKWSNKISLMGNSMKMKRKRDLKIWKRKMVWRLRITLWLSHYLHLIAMSNLSRKALAWTCHLKVPKIMLILYYTIRSMSPLKYKCRHSRKDLTPFSQYQAYNHLYMQVVKVMKFSQLFADNHAKGLNGQILMS
jgi:hypothetical protein